MTNELNQQKKNNDLRETEMQGQRGISTTQAAGIPRDMAAEDMAAGHLGGTSALGLDKDRDTGTSHFFLQTENSLRMFQKI